MALALLLAALAAVSLAQLNNTATVTIRDSLAVHDPTIAPISLLVDEDEVSDILVTVRLLAARPTHKFGAQSSFEEHPSQ